MKLSAANPPHVMPVQQKITSYEIGRRLGKKDPRKELLPTVPCGKYAREEFRVLQLNISGLQNKTTELQHLLSKHEVHVALIQETILPKKKDVTITGYTQYKCECQKCQGVMTLIRNDVNGEVQNSTTNDIDWQTIKVWTSTEAKYTIYNFYCPPGSTTRLPVTNETFQKTVIAGDFNAHIPLLGYTGYNAMGQKLESFLNESNLILQQNGSTPPTLLHRAHGTTSRPDLTLLSADLQDQTTTQVLEDIGSDHLPILTTINTQKCVRKHHQRRQTLWNFKKANWNRYKEETDTELQTICMTGNIDTTYKTICKTILSSAKRYIPRGNRKKFKPYWTSKLQEAVKQRRKARKNVEKEPTPSNKKAYNKLTGKVRYLTKTSKTQAWRENCAKLDLKKEGHKTWRLLNNLEGKSTKSNPQPLKCGNAEILNSRSKAEAFNKHFANTNKAQHRKQLDKALWKATRKQKQPATKGMDGFNKPFSLCELETAAKKLKNRKAPGPDGIRNELIKNLGHQGKLVLLEFINRTWIEGSLPSAWRTAVISPILKKGKPPGHPQSYRPISLTSCIGKLAERMVNCRLYWWLEDNKLLDNAQAGFRRGCRTEDQLFRLVQDTLQGFKQEKHTYGVFIDLQQAYDRVWRKGLFIKMHKLGIQGRLSTWIQAFLRDRTIATRYAGATSSRRTLEEGLPQGSALSCTLFIIFLNDLPKYLNVSKALFADDLAIWTTDKYPILARAKLKRALLTLGVYCELWKLKINTNKTVYSIFTLSHKVSKTTLDLKLKGESLRKEDNPVYLGITLDKRMTLANHLEELKEKATKRLNLIKRLATTTWGANKQTLRQLYLGYVRAVMDYNLPLQTVASTTSVAALDLVQNQALRLICGAMRSTPTAACEIEANIKPRDLHRNTAVVETIERYRRLEQNHPNKQQVDSWKPVARLQLKTLMDVGTELAEKHQLPQERQQQPRIFGPAPWEKMFLPTVKTTLMDKSVNKNTLPTLLKAYALETIESYPTTSIHSYTDGSAFKATKNAGYGFFLKFPDGKVMECCESCGTDCSNYEAEILAIRSTIETAHQQFELQLAQPSNIVVFSDSLSALDAIQNPPYQDHEISLTVKAISNLISTFTIEVTLQWIPGHTGVVGNEKADKLAKEGAAKTQRNTPSSLTTVKQILRTNEKEDWLNRWANGSTGRAMFHQMTQPKPHDTINALSRQDQSLIFQFRTQHARTNFHLNMFKPQHEPHCRHCDYPYETTKHLLLDCLMLSSERKALLPTKPSLDNTLYSSTTQLRKTANFIRLALTAKE